MTLFQQLKRYRGALTKVSADSGYSYHHVRNVLTGKSDNDYIRLKALKVLAERKGLDNLLGELNKLERQILQG